MIFAASCFSQPSTSEEWTGTLKRKGKQKESITLDVQITEKGPYITRMIYAGTTFEFKRQQFKGDSLTFYWAPGNKDVKCELQLEDELKYVGKCQAEESANKIVMQIRPLRKLHEQPASSAQVQQEQDNESAEDRNSEDKGKGKQSKKNKGS